MHGKSEATITNNKRLRSRLMVTVDIEKHEASHGLSVTAELHV